MNSVTINFGEKPIDFHFGLGFLGELVDSFDLSVVDLGEKAVANPLKYEPLIMYCSAVYAKKRKGESLDLTQYEFIDLIEEVGGIYAEPCQLFNKAFQESMNKDVPQQPQHSNKKKVK